MAGRDVDLRFEVGRWRVEAAELLADAVGEITGGVEIRDSGTSDSGWSRVAPSWSRCAAPETARASCWREIEAVCARAREAGLAVDPVAVRQREAHEDEWRDVWKKYFRATRVGETFIVRPSWDLERCRPDRRIA